VKKLIWLSLFLVGLLALQSLPAGAAAALGTHTKFTPTAGQTNGGTTAAINTATGTNNFIVISVGSDRTASPPNVSDSATNTWYLAAAKIDGGNFGQSRLYFCVNCNTSATHTFTVTGTNQYISFEVASFSGMSTAPFDPSALSSGNCGSCTTVQFGSITPANNNSLVISAINPTSTSTTTSMSINGGFTVIEQVQHASGLNYGSGIAYLVQTTAAAANPTWTITGSGTFYLGGTNAAFKDSTVTPTAYSSKISAYPILQAGTASAMSASKMNAYPILQAGNANAMSVSKMNTYVILSPEQTLLLHSFPP